MITRRVIAHLSGERSLARLFDGCSGPRSGAEAVVSV